MKLSLISFLKRKQQTEPDAPHLVPLGLKPLYPENGKPGHDIYVRELEEAVANPAIYNIALTGNYGSGKSSILSDFAKTFGTKKKGRIIQVSLSTLGSRTDTDKSENDEELTNAIQKEIIKQLLFREAPQNVPNSKFKRIAAPNLLRIFLFAGLISLAALVATYYFLGNSLLYKLAGTGFWQQLPVASSLFITLFSLAALCVLGLSNNFIISKLTGGPVTLAVTDKNNYFDEYLDELIYFFQVTQYEIVVFEDIERFENTLIFRTLKQLNTLLNDSGQVRATGRRIRFIYAIRDSLFSKDELISAYDQSTDRAKFFDLIIPVVPFVTHQNSNDIFMKMFNSEGNIDISKEIVATVARYITDMRLIKNIYNEYLIFAERVLGKDKLEGLTKDRLFVMVVYKNTNLKDFELIKTGSSKLDDIYEKYRQTINDEVAKTNHRINANRIKIEKPDSLGARSDEYGQKLVSFLENITSAIQPRPSGTITYSLHGVNYTVEQMKSLEFWDIVSAMGPSDSFNVSYTMPPYNSQQSLSLDRNKIEQIIGAAFDIERLEAADKDALRQENSNLKKELKDMRRKTIDGLMSMSPDFSKFVKDSLTDGVYTGLVYDLVAAGYIDSYFALYTSIFHGTNPKAANFLIHHLQLDRPDFSYKFEGDANIKSLLKDSGGAYSRSKSIYNIEILDYLISTAKPAPSLQTEAHILSHITNNLIQNEPEDKDFLGAYMRTGKFPEKLIELLSNKWSGTFEYVVLRSDADEKMKSTTFNAALQGSNENIQYAVGETVTDYLNNNAAKFELFRSPSASSSLGPVLTQLGAKFTSLRRFHKDLKDIAVANNLYAINRENLETAVGAKNLALNKIRELNETVFNYVATNLKSYLSSIADSKKTKYTIDDASAFTSVINHIAESDAENLDDIIRGASPECSVDDLTEVSERAWLTLLDIGGTRPRIGNILAYYRLDASGAIDQRLSQYLAKESEIIMDSSEDTEELAKLAVAILSDTRIASETRSKLVKEMELENYLAVDSFPPQNSDLYGYLVRDDIIEDSAETYNYLKNSDPSTRLFYIINSKKIAQYLNQIKLDSDEISAIASSSEVNPDVKSYLVTHLPQFDPKPPASAIKDIAGFAASNDMSLDAITLHAMLDGANATDSIELINLSGESFTREGMIGMFKVIDGGYEKLAQPGKHVQLDDTQYNIKLTERLKNLGMVSSVSQRKTRNGNKLIVNMKKSW